MGAIQALDIVFLLNSAAHYLGMLACHRVNAFQHTLGRFFLAGMCFLAFARGLWTWSHRLTIDPGFFWMIFGLDFFMMCFAMVLVWRGAGLIQYFPSRRVTAHAKPSTQ